MKRYLLVFLLACSIGCQTLPAVVADLANIAQIVIADVEKGMAAPAILADVIAQDASATIDVILAVISGLLADPKTPPADVLALQNLHDEAMARKAAQK